MSKVEIHVSPSKLERAMECTGYPLLAESIPDPLPTQWSELGTKAHAAVLGAVKAGDASEVLNLVDGMDGIELPMADAWTRWAEYILGLVSNRHGKSPVMVERKLEKLQELGMVPKGREGEHQADVIWVDSKRWNLLDLKSGKGKVEVKGNKQLLSYAWALACEMGILDSDWEFNLWIFQPPVSHDAECWTVTMAEIRAFGKEAASKIKEAEEGGQLKEGNWCKYCPVGDAGACLLKNGRKEARADAVGLAKANAAEIFSHFEKENVVIGLPSKAEDILIPEEADAQIKAMLSKEADILAVGKGNLQECSDLLKEIGLVEQRWADAEALGKKPYALAKKAWEDAFDPNEKALAASKASLKKKFQFFYDAEQRRQDAEIAKQKAEQDRIAKELAEKEAAAQKLKGAAKAKADAEAQALRDKAAEASVVKAPAPISKAAGIASKEVWTIDIPDVSKIPARYLITHEGALTIQGDKSIVVVEVDGKVMSADAKAGRLAKADWCKATKSSGVSAR